MEHAWVVQGSYFDLSFFRRETLNVDELFNVTLSEWLGDLMDMETTSAEKGITYNLKFTLIGKI